MDNRLKGLCSLLLGIIIGFAFSPIKQGIHVKVCHNGNVEKDDE